MNSFETWHYLNGAYIAHGKQWITNGVVSHNIDLSPAAQKWDYDKDDVLDEDSEFCYRVIFSTNNTYICFYMDHTAEVAKWEWTNPYNGVLHYWDPWDSDNSDWEGDTTVRFKGKQMRIYENYNWSENGFSLHMIGVNTLTAGY